MKRSRWAVALLATAWCGAAGPTFAQSQPSRDLVQGGRRLALVVGIDGYPRSPLLNARNDARAITATLRELGFDVTAHEDIARGQLVAALSTFGDHLRPDDVAFFFYAGHGLQIDGENYLVPADFDGSTPSAVRLNTLPVSEIQMALSRAKVSVLVLDACRNNPFASTRSAGRGLAPMEARGNIIAFATGAGQTSSDNPTAGNGLFTQQLLATLREPNLPLREVFYRVRQRVYEATNGQQFPAVYDGLLGEFVLRPSTDVAAAVTPAASRPAPPPAAFPAARPAAPSDAAGSSAAHSMRFELFHLRNDMLTAGLDAGVLSITPGRIQWSETGQAFSLNPNKRPTTRSDRDDFDTPCSEIAHITKTIVMDRTTRWRGTIRIGRKDYDFWVTETIKGKLDYRTPPSNVFEAIRAACPGIVVK